MKQPISKFMTYSPHTINSGMSVETARKMMKKYGVRHLPVQVAGHLVGIVTERDFLLGSSLDKDGHLFVDDVMTPDPYSVAENAPLGEVVEQLAEHRFGCAVVLGEKGNVKGIFTVVDALRALADGRNVRARKGTIAKGSVA